MNWSIRGYRNGDEARIRELHQQVFGEEFLEERWHWQFKANGTNVVIIALAEAEDGELVGQCALRPVRMRIEGRACLGVLSQDAMVHPDYRRQGVFTKLASYAYQVAADQGIPLVYGFPNKNSHHVLAHKLNRVDLWSSAPLFVKILNARNVLAKRIRSKFLVSLAAPLGEAALRLLLAPRKRMALSGYRLERVARFDERVTNLWKKASVHFGIAVVRDQEYLNWRYLENPTEAYVPYAFERDGQLVGYLVLKCEVRFGLQIGFIVDMLTIPDEQEIGDSMISEAVAWFRGQQMDMVGCLMFEHVRYAKSLRSNGFVKTPQKLLPQDLHLSVRRLSDEYTEQYITGPQNWFITWGDHDVV